MILNQDLVLVSRLLPTVVTFQLQLPLRVFPLSLPSLPSLPTLDRVLLRSFDLFWVSYFKYLVLVSRLLPVVTSVVKLRFCSRDCRPTSFPGSLLFTLGREEERPWERGWLPPSYISITAADACFSTFVAEFFSLSTLDIQLRFCFVLFQFFGFSTLC